DAAPERSRQPLPAGPRPGRSGAVAVRASGGDPARSEAHLGLHGHGLQPDGARALSGGGDDPGAGPAKSRARPEHSVPLRGRRAELMRAQRQYTQLDPILAAPTSPKPQAAIVRFERLIEEGRYAEAAAWYDQALAKEAAAPTIYRLYAAAGLLLAGDQRAAS